MESVAFSEAPSQTPSADSTALQAVASGAVNQVAKDINKIKLNDPVDRSLGSDTLNERLTAEPRQTNQDPSELRYFLKTSERCKKGSFRGLLNQGATCYLNATLQVLFMTEAFRERVLLTPSDTRENLESALKELFEELSKQDRGDQSVSAKGVIKALGIERVYEQQDAVEYFLDILEKVGPNLAEVFSGTIRNNRACSENHKSHDDSSFKSIQITLNSSDGPYKVEDGVRSYFASTKLVGEDQMYCENCDEKSDTEWSCEIHEYPTILALHLKRFVYDYRSCHFVKNSCPMDVPLLLSLWEQEYSLYAVINHSGSRFGGHYTADIRSFTENKWYCFDDSRVTETDESKLKRSTEAYLLLYQKTSSVAQVADVKEEPKTTEPGEPVEGGSTELCAGAHNKPQLEGVSADSATQRHTGEEEVPQQNNATVPRIFPEQSGKNLGEGKVTRKKGPHSNVNLKRRLSTVEYIEMTSKASKEVALLQEGLSCRTSSITEDANHSWDEKFRESPDNRDLPSTSTTRDITLKTVPDHTLPIGTSVTTACPIVKIDASFCGESFSHRAYDITKTNLQNDTDGTEICPKRFKGHREIISIADVIKSLAEKVDETSDFSVCITRDWTLETGLKQWQQQKKSSPKNPLRVTFTGEAGTDNDTLRKEFLTEMMTGIVKQFFEGGENGKTPKYSMTDMDKHNFKTIGEIFAVSITQGGPPPNFFMEWCYNYISAGEVDLEEITERDVTDPALMELIKEIKAADHTTLMERRETISLCGYKEAVSIERKEDIVRSVVLHATVRLVPMLQQICSGMKLYGLLTSVQQETDICRQLFVPGSFTKVDADFLVKSLSPVFSEKGPMRHQRESRGVFFPQNFVQDIKDEEEGKNNSEHIPEGETKDEEVDKAEKHTSDTPING